MWDNWADRHSYSQFGEDAIVLSHFYNKNWKFTKSFKDLKLGFYVDIGAHHPYIISNTWALYQMGWHGIVVDPNPGIKELFEKYRPNDTFLEVACSDIEGSIKFYKDGNSPMNTVVQDVAKGIGYDDYIEVPALSLKTIFELNTKQGSPIDFLNVDVEGHDLAVLKSNDWKLYRPELICVEHHVDNLEDLISSEIFQFMTLSNYKLSAWSKPSLIFRDSYS
jgi:FkbM family methyltransferase